MEYRQPKSATPNLHFQASPLNVKDLKIDLENWMGGLPEHLTCLPIIYLSIPDMFRQLFFSRKNVFSSSSTRDYNPKSSHNSFSYSISPNSGVSPDSPPFVQSLGKWCKPISNRIIFNWSQGQQQDVVQQLCLGIRYFDVRLVVNHNDIVVCHGLYGGRIQDFLEQINSFLSSHEKEIVILDFQHFYQFEAEHHEKMISLLVNIFGSKICRRQRKMKENTINILREYGNQVLIICRNEVTRFNDIFWPSGLWDTPWPNKVRVNELIECLNKNLLIRRDGMGFVSQGILTPTPKYVALHVFGSLRKLATETNKKVIAWLETKSNGVHGINVIICDFVERYNFCEKVIKLNYKGLNTNQTHYIGNNETIHFYEF